MGSPRVYPGSNYKGYEAADATKVVGNLKGKMFLLVHGTADDNVHYHHSMMLAKALVDEDVLFQQMVGWFKINMNVCYMWLTPSVVGCIFHICSGYYLSILYSFRNPCWD